MEKNRIARFGSKASLPRLESCRVARNVVKITLPTEMDAISTEVMHTIQARKHGKRPKGTERLKIMGY